MKQDDTLTKSRPGGKGNGNPYARMSGFNSDRNAGTYVPEMHEDAPGVSSNTSETENVTPVVGFLYSISRKGIGEYWPLHLGTNTIGRSAECDICLREMSVSEHHADIYIKQMRTTHKLIASIRDVGSKNGIFLNDEELDYENHTCNANDLIVIGRNYKMLLLLIDAEQCGLSVAEDFTTVDDVETEPLTPNYTQTTRANSNLYSSRERKFENGTVDLSGVGFGDPGNTKFM